MAWAAIGAIVSRLVASAGAAATETAVASAAARAASATATKAGAQAVAKGAASGIPLPASSAGIGTSAAIPPVRMPPPGANAAPPPAPGQGGWSMQSLFDGLKSTLTGKGSASRPGTPESQQAAADIAKRIKQQAMGAAFSMGSSLVSNTVGSIAGGLATGGQLGGGQPGQNFAQRGLANLGAGPAGQRVGQLIGQPFTAAKNTVMAANPALKGAAMVGKFAFDVTPIGMLTKAAIKTAGAFSEVVHAAEAWGAELLAGQKHLTAFNGTIANMFGESERRDILRNIKSGKETAGSTKRLGEAYDNLKDDLQPARDVATNVLNNIAASVLSVVSAGVRLLKPIAETAKFITDNWPWGDGKDAEPSEAPFIAFMNDLRDRPANSPRAPRQ